MSNDWCTIAMAPWHTQYIKKNTLGDWELNDILTHLTAPILYQLSHY